MTEAPGFSRDLREAGGFVRFRGCLAYDGSAFRGWARQPGLRTVQGVFEEALAILAQIPVPVVVAGRTDTGVHARRQVIHFDIPEAVLERWERAAGDGGLGEWVTYRLRRLLRRSPDLVVRRLAPADPGFNARFSAVWREYSYRIWDADAPLDPLLRGFVLDHFGRPLSVETLTRAGHQLLGLHDWRAFCRPSEHGTTVRELQEFRWERGDDGIVTATLRADAFCHHMVRCLVGACLALSPERLAEGQLLRWRDAAAPTSGYSMVPSHGLVLERVGYPAPEAYAARARQTMAKRAPLSRPEDAPGLASPGEVH